MACHFGSSLPLLFGEKRYPIPTRSSNMSHSTDSFDLVESALVTEEDALAAHPPRFLDPYRPYRVEGSSSTTERGLLGLFQFLLGSIQNPVIGFGGDSHSDCRVPWSRVGGVGQKLAWHTGAIFVIWRAQAGPPC